MGTERTFYFDGFTNYGYKLYSPFTTATSIRVVAERLIDEVKGIVNRGFLGEATVGEVPGITTIHGHMNIAFGEVCKYIADVAATTRPGTFDVTVRAYSVERGEDMRFVLHGVMIHNAVEGELVEFVAQAMVPWHNARLGACDDVEAIGPMPIPDITTVASNEAQRQETLRKIVNGLRNGETTITISDGPKPWDEEAELEMAISIIRDGTEPNDE